MYGTNRADSLDGTKYFMPKFINKTFGQFNIMQVVLVI